ncbi:MAG: hypothetical protein LBP59_02375 [Planctomycetaceae bacterium]|nr:hypothetical protein [Planctomycetaceae bacterium]
MSCYLNCKNLGYDNLSIAYRRDRILNFSESKRKNKNAYFRQTIDGGDCKNFKDE